MSRNLRSIGLSLILAGSMALCGTATAEVVRINTYGPPKHPHVVAGYTPYMKAVEAATGGSLTFKLFTGGSLLGAKATPDGLRDGVIDVGLIALTYFPAEFPHIQVVADLAMYGDSAPAMAAATIEYTLLHCKPCIDDFEKHGIVYAGGHSSAPYHLISQKPMVSPADFNGKKVRTAGSVYDRWVKFMGDVPVNIGAGEMYEALNRGQLDAVIHATTALQTFSLWDTAKHITMIPLGTYHAIGTTAFSAKFWRRITPAERKALWDHAALANIGPSVRFEIEDGEVLGQAATKGITVHKPSAALMEARTRFMQQDMAVILETARTKYGIKDPKPMADTFIALVKKWHDIYAPMGTDVKAMAARLKTEVYDKIDPNKFGM